MNNKKIITILSGILVLLIIIFLYRYFSKDIEVSLLNGTDFAICSSIGIFVLSIIITLIRRYK